MPDTQEPKWSRWSPLRPGVVPPDPSLTDSPSGPPRTPRGKSPRTAILEAIKAKRGRMRPLPKLSRPPFQMTRPVSMAILRMLSDWVPPAQIQKAIKDEFGVEISLSTIIRRTKTLRDDEKAYVETLRAELDAQLQEIPISRRYYRMKIRQDLLTMALESETLDSKEIRCILLDAAKEMGHLEPNVQINNFGGDINLTQIALIQKIQSLTNEQLRAYVEHGELPLPAGVSPANGNGNKVIEAAKVEADGTTNGG